MKTTPAPGVPIVVDDPEAQPLRTFPTCLRMPVPCPEPGVYHDIPDAEYHRWAAVSQSLLKQCLDEFDGGCPAICRHYMDSCESEPTDAQAFGTAYHTLALQGEGVFRARYPAIIEHESTGPRGGTVRKTRRDPEWKAAIEAHGDGAVLWDDDVAVMRRMLAALQGHKYAGPIVAGPGKREVALVWDDPDFGIRCKARCDWLHDRYAADLKTTEDASPLGFGRSAATYGYHVQAAWYRRGLVCLHKLGKLATGARPFVLFAQRKSPPYIVAPYVVTASEYHNGEGHIGPAMYELTRSLDTGEWPGYGDDVQELRMPTWAGGPGREEEEGIN